MHDVVWHAVVIKCHLSPTLCDPQPPTPSTATAAPIMLRDIREELRREKPANKEIAAMPVPVDSTTLSGG